MKILMTGGTGLVGNALGQELVRQGHEIVLLARDKQKARERLSFPCEIHDWSGEVPSQKIIADVEAVIHLAGENIAAQRWTAARKEQLRLSRLGTTSSLVEAFRTRGKPLKVFIGASAVGVYGDREEELLTEKSANGVGFLSELCREWETLSSQVPAERHVHARLGVVMSALGGFLDQVSPLFQMLGASRLGSGRQYLSWVHIQDVVQILLTALTDSRYRDAINVVSPNTVTNSELTQALKSVLGVFSAPPVPALSLKVLYGELSQVLLGSQRVQPATLQSLGYRFQFESLEHALKDIYPDLEPGDVQLTFEHWVPSGVDEVWDFYSDESNLERITPPQLNFRVVSKSTPKIEKGTLIDYKLKVHGLPLKWRTLIQSWEPKRRFSDTQLKGPYQKWHHVHEFAPLAEGVVTRDQIRLQLPMGVLGRMAGLKFVLNDVRKIFAHRSKVITQLFSVR